MATLTAERLGGRTTTSFYSWLAAGFVLVAFLGFTPTYWAPLTAGAFHANPVVHVHGVVFFAWTLFFMSQSFLAGGGNLPRHRALGLAGASLATAMAILGPLAALNSLSAGESLGVGARAEAFTIVPLSGIAAFAILVTLALANTRRPELHKRLMVLSMIAILDAPMARPFLAFVFTALPPGPPPVWAPLPAYGVVDLFLVAAVAFDLRTRGRPHPAYLIGGGAIIAMQLLRLPISETAAWHGIARSFLGLAGALPPGHA